jgi:pimeloyl-ACP methyl ester carboxylesterase
MARPVTLRFWVGFAALAFGLAALAPTTPAQTAGKDKAVKDYYKERVPIPTADGVDLDGTFYRPKGANPGTNAPCVMLIHRYNSDRTKGEWNALAEKLQDKGFAVLAFDLRGHGNSTQISQPSVFWSQPWNRNGISRASERRTSIAAADFHRAYFPMLVNDLVAARRFLDTKHDARECNAGSLYVVGAQEGAALGLLWLAYEADRKVPATIGVFGVPASYRAAIDDVAGCCWLGATIRPQNINFNVTDWLNRFPAIREKVPMCFFYGEDNRADAETARNLYDHVTRKVSGRDKHKLDVKFPLPKTRLAGQDLLTQRDLGVADTVGKFFDRVGNERKAIPWAEFNVRQQIPQLVPLNVFGFSPP